MQLTYTIPNGSTYLVIRKIHYSSIKYYRATIEFYTKSGILIDTMKNTKLYYEKIRHWELVNGNSN